MRLVLGLALAIAALVATFVWLRAGSPSDGVRLAPADYNFLADGISISLSEARPGELQEGDRLIALAGQSVEYWARALFEPAAARPAWSFGQTVTYTVVRDGQRVDVPVILRPYSFGAWLAGYWGILALALGFESVAASVFVRRPHDPAARVMFLASSCLAGSMIPWSLGLQLSDLTGALGFWLYAGASMTCYTLAFMAGLHFVLVFPRPLLAIARRAWLAPSIYLSGLALLLGYVWLSRASTESTLRWIGLWNTGENMVIIPYLSLTLLVTLLAYRHARRDAIMRQQVRWVVFAFIVSDGAALLLGIIPEALLGHALVDWNVLGLLGLPIPLAIAVAILRYRLFEIDALINRTLVYGALSALLALIYLASVVLLRALFRALTGEQPELVTVISTLAIAALFVPLRGVIQRSIDRRFYRRKYDAAKTLQAFSATVRDEVDLDTLRQNLLGVVEDTMQPAHVSLWLRQTDGKR